MQPRLAILVILLVELAGAQLRCPSGEQPSFEKRLGVRPSRQPPALFAYKPGDSPGADWVTLECVKKCSATPECSGALVTHEPPTCTGYGVGIVTGDPAIPDPGAALFIKICMRVPDSCGSRLWTIESTPGYQLIPSLEESVRIVGDVSASQCSAMLASSRQMRSAQFRPTPGKDSEAAAGGAKGSCAMSADSKHTRPDAYRVDNSEDVLYLENQCVEDYERQIDRCSYEEHHNNTLRHYDVILQGVSTPECRRRCEGEARFNCRGFTAIPQESRPYYRPEDTRDGVPDSVTCLLHSEDILGVGSWLIVKKTGAVYYRRVLCLNVTVECSPNAMTVTYWPRSDFRGRLYVNGHSDRCSAHGLGRTTPTRLSVPFEACGVRTAYSLYDAQGNPDNRTLMYTMLVIQNNPIIQSQGDRFVRVGCVAIPAMNVTLGTDISVGDESLDKLEDNNTVAETVVSASHPASSFINTTSAASMPRIRMYIINDPHIRERMGQIGGGGAVALGETIELRIDADRTPKGLVDIHAYHLVASSQLGDSSVLLLDSRGCPTNQVDFPTFQRTIVDGVVRLSSKFRAFRFPNSHVVKFSVMVQFCVGPCPQVTCPSPSQPSGNRRTRSVKNVGISTVETFDDSTITLTNSSDFHGPESMAYAHVVVATTDDGASSRIREMCRELQRDERHRKLPLELSLVVASNEVFAADRLIFGESGVELGRAGESQVRPTNRAVAPGSICMNETLFVTVALVWLGVQVVILIWCLVVVRRYRRFAEDNAYHKDYQSFDNVGFDNVAPGRRVHWPDQNVDILHAN